MTCACSAQHEPPAPVLGPIGRRAVLAGGLAAGITPFLLGRGRPAGAEATSEGVDETPAGVTRDFGFLPPRPTGEVHVRPMMFPVLPDATLGKASWSDTYLAPRGSGRLHEGQDLMGKKMLKLLACVSGTIVELRHRSTGNSLYLRDDDGWYYCYLHINNDDPNTDNGANQFRYAFAPGLATGSKVKKGDLLGYLGDSGNAESTLPHCHFEIRMPNAKWYNAAAVNAKYSLEKAEPAKLGASATTAPAAGTFAPFASARSFATQQAADFLAGTATAAWIDNAVRDLESGGISPDDFIEQMLDEPAVDEVVSPTVRLYLGYFLRQPDTSGINYWISQVRAGTALDAVSSRFAASSEFENRYGSLGNAEFVSRIYTNLFSRNPDPSGHLYWTAKLDQGASRGWVMRQLCESGEYQRKTASQVGVIAVHLAMLGRAPRADEFVFWTTRARATGVRSMVELVRTGAEYASRVTSRGN